MENNIGFEPAEPENVDSSFLLRIVPSREASIGYLQRSQGFTIRLHSIETQRCCLEHLNLLRLGTSLLLLRLLLLSRILLRKSSIPILEIHKGSTILFYEGFYSLLMPINNDSGQAHLRLRFDSCLLHFSKTNFNLGH